MDEPDYLRNRRAWNAASDEYQRRHGPQLATAPLAWGVWSLPESELDLLGPAANRDVLEFGCGAAQWSVALAQRGARCTGLDNSERQLDHARAAVAAARVDVRLVHGAAEAPPFAPASFDIVFCDHGAFGFSAPEVTIPAAARLLRPGGILAFSVEHPLHEVCWDPAADAIVHRLVRPYFRLAGTLDAADGMVSHTRPISTYLRLLAESGLVLERLLEPQPPAGAVSSYDFVGLDWARDFPAELMLRARRPS